MSFMNITFEMIYHVVSAYMDAIGILLVPCLLYTSDAADE